MEYENPVEFTVDNAQQCPSCKAVFTKAAKYCPHCGAKMDKSTQSNDSNTLDALERG